jgi:hypothetical protein
MGRKLLVSMAIEGKFSDSGLQAMDDGADVLTTLARELVMHQGVGQSADEVWKALQTQQPQSQPWSCRCRNRWSSNHGSPCRDLLPRWYLDRTCRRWPRAGESLQHLVRINSRYSDFAQYGVHSKTT